MDAGRECSASAEAVKGCGIQVASVRHTNSALSVDLDQIDSGLFG